MSNVECTILNFDVRSFMLLHRKLCPNWGVIGWVFPTTHFTIDAGRDAVFSQTFACQYSVNAQSAVFFERTHLIVPPRKKVAFHVMYSKRVAQAEVVQLSQGRAFAVRSH